MEEQGNCYENRTYLISDFLDRQDGLFSVQLQSLEVFQIPGNALLSVNGVPGQSREVALRSLTLRDESPHNVLLHFDDPAQ